MRGSFFALSYFGLETGTGPMALLTAAKNTVGRKIKRQTITQAWKNNRSTDTYATRTENWLSLSGGYDLPTPTTRLTRCSFLNRRRELFFFLAPHSQSPRPPYYPLLLESTRKKKERGRVDETTPPKIRRQEGNKKQQRLSPCHEPRARFRFGGSAGSGVLTDTASPGQTPPTPIRTLDQTRHPQDSTNSTLLLKSIPKLEPLRESKIHPRVPLDKKQGNKSQRPRSSVGCM